MTEYILTQVPVFGESGERTYTSYTRINQMQAADPKDGRVLAIHDREAELWFYHLDMEMKNGEICMDRISDGFSGLDECGGHEKEFARIVEMGLTDYAYRVVVLALKNEKANREALRQIRRMQPQARICYAVACEGGSYTEAAQTLAEMARGLSLKPAVRPECVSENTVRNGREFQEWVNFRIDDRRKKRRVLLVGDSISWGFYDGVRARLSDVLALDAVQTSADVADDALYRNMNLLLDRYDYECIHIGIGGHSSRIDSAPGAYEKNMAFILRYLKTRQPRAALIWSNSTICVLNDLKTPNEEINAFRAARNRIAEAACAEAGVSVDDLETVSYRSDLHRIDHVHYGDYTPFAESVAAHINRRLK